MKKSNLHILGILAAIGYWIVESAMHAWIFHPEHSLLWAFFPHDFNELWMRSIIAALLTGTGFYLRKLFLQNQQATREIMQILESTTDGYMAIDKNLNIRYANKLAEQILHIKCEDVLGKNIWDAFPEAVSTFFKEFSDAISNRKSLVATGFYSAVGKWIEAHVTPTEDGTAFYFRDVTEHVLLKETNKKLNNIIGHASDGIITINKRGQIETFNEAAEIIFGYSHDEIIGKNISILMTENHADMHNKFVKDYIVTGKSKIIDVGPREVIARRKDGSSFPLDISVNEMHYGDQLYFVGIVRDITERWKAQNQLKQLSQYDYLTGLPNRSLFNDRISHALSNAKRLKNHLALMFIDLDKFKEVNDTLGHAAGDQLLVTVAKRIQECIRESDTASRLSGDEFTVILQNIKNESDAVLIAEKILKSLSQPVDLDGNQTSISCSIGISLYPNDARTAEELIQEADSAMYRAKRAGRNTYRF